MYHTAALLSLLVLALTAVPGWTPDDDCGEEGGVGCCVLTCHSCFCCAAGGSAVLAAGVAPALLAPVARVPMRIFLPRRDVMPRPILHVPRFSLLA